MAHAYMRAVLGRLGLPDSVLNIIGALYDQNKCVIKVAGGHFDGFQLLAGIRQGCPLSPLLFAVTVDILLRKLAKDHPDSVIRAFADDTAMVSPDLWRDASAIAAMFNDFGQISGLTLNIPKTVAIPLWPFGDGGSGSDTGISICGLGWCYCSRMGVVLGFCRRSRQG